jgi:hypothetical protein
MISSHVILKIFVLSLIYEMKHNFLHHTQRIFYLFIYFFFQFVINNLDVKFGNYRAIPIVQ